ncbi:MAG: hypothetical protein EOM50_10980 [Erysipelotrichia bacterium]|nr:hypothetical protein [Erysipelotrichia bacterium]NCC55123.1 hypothetical protein [Erysipelotrichia bacterium]
MSIKSIHYFLGVALIYAYYSIYKGFFTILKASEWIIDKVATTSETGSKHKECLICGETLETKMIEKLSVNENGESTTDDDSGKVKKDTIVEENAPQTSFNNNVNELREMVLTPEEEQAVANGEDIKIYLNVKNVDKTVSKEEKELVMKEVIGKDTNDVHTIFLDVSLYKQVGNKEAVSIKELSNGKISVTIKVPEEYRKKNRAFQFLHVHNGEVKNVEGVYDEESGNFTFETNQFSTYVMAYHDHEYVKKQDGTNEWKECSICKEKIEMKKINENTVNTGDSSNTTLFVSMMVLSGAILCLFLWNKHRKEQE